MNSIRTKREHSAMPDQKGYINSLTELIKRIPVFDSHEHIYRGSGLCRDFFTAVMSTYVFTDILSAGYIKNTVELCDCSRDDSERWRIFEPIWNEVKLTGYAQCISQGVAEVYGVQEITGQTIGLIQEKFRNQTIDCDIFKFLRTNANITGGSICLNEFPPYFIPVPPGWFMVPKIDEGLIELTSTVKIERLCGYLNATLPASIDDYCDCAVAYLEMLRSEHGVRVFKTGQAYRRQISYSNPDRASVEDIYRSLLSSGELAFNTTIPLQDYIMHKLLVWMEKKNIIMQIHTGLTAGKELIERTGAHHLESLLMQHPNLRVVIFHGSYPFTSYLGALIKNYPNVYADMCWLHAISPAGARQALREWLELFLYTKIFAFGGDFRLDEVPFCSIGHLSLARRNVASVLGGMTDEGLMSECEAAHVAECLMFRNAQAVYQDAIQACPYQK